MTPADLRAWQAHMGYTYDTAAAALGVSRAAYADWIAGRSPPPRASEGLNDPISVAAIFLIALSGGVTPFAVIGPVTITLLLLFVSGVPLLEKSMKDKPGYAEYAAKTSIFVPWFPKK